jgi:hypothetical protein
LVIFPKHFWSHWPQLGLPNLAKENVVKNKMSHCKGFWLFDRSRDQALFCADIFQLGNFASKILCAAKTAHFAVIYSSKILTSVVIFSKGVYPCQQKRFGTDLQKRKQRILTIGYLYILCYTYHM